MVVKYEPSGWLSTEVIAFKTLQSCLYKRSLIETGEETKRRLWQRSKKGCIIFKSDSDAPYTERQYVKFGRTKDLNKWSISTWEYCSFLRDLKTCKHLFALTNFSLTCSLNLQLLWKVTPEYWCQVVSFYQQARVAFKNVARHFCLACTTVVSWAQLNCHLSR